MHVRTTLDSIMFLEKKNFAVCFIACYSGRIYGRGRLIISCAHSKKTIRKEKKNHVSPYVAFALYHFVFSNTIETRSLLIYV